MTTLRYEFHFGCGRAGLRAAPDDSFGVAIFDPPFSELTHARFGKEVRTDGAKERGGISFEPITIAQIEETAALLARTVRRWVVIKCDDHSFDAWKQAVTRAGLEYIRQGAWFKTGPMPQMSGDRPAVGFENFVIAHRPGAKEWNGGGKPAVYRAGPQEPSVPRIHENQMPLRLCRELIEDFSNPGEVVLDLYAGGATLGVAAHQLKRGFVGWENRIEAYEPALQRLLGVAIPKDGKTLPLFG